jgi:phage terminase large subunit-like protein
MSWNLSCPDWRERLFKGQSLVPHLPLIQSEADMGIAFFDNIHLPDVIGRPLLRDAAGEWQRDIVRAVFGSYDPVADERHISEFFVLVPKKNNKTTGSAAIMVTALLMNRRPLADYILVAPTQEVSGKPFSQAAGMIRSDPELMKRFQIRDHIKEIVDRTNGATLKVKSFSPEVLTGSIAAGVLVDELHVAGKQASAADVMIQLRGGYLTNPSMFMIFITTQSDEPPEGIFKEELDLARNVRDGKVIDDVLPIIYEFPEEFQKSGAWRDQSTWPLVNPNIGLSISEKRLHKLWNKATLKGPGEEILFASQNLNIEIGIGMNADRWEGADFWEKPENINPELASLDYLMKMCEVAVVGIDGGGLDDLLGLAVLGRVKDEKRDITQRKWMLWVHAWAHNIVKERRPQLIPKLEMFEQAKELTFVETPGDDVEEVVEIVMKLDAAQLLPQWTEHKQYKAVGVDAVGIGEIVDGLALAEFDILRIEPISQGWRLNGAIKTSARKLAGGNLIHAGTKLMNWCVDNAKSEPVGSAVKITKQAAGKAKIDPLAAMFDCVELMAKNPEASRSIYEEEEIFV